MENKVENKQKIPCLECELYPTDINLRGMDDPCFKRKCEYDKKIAREVAWGVYWMMHGRYCDGCGKYWTDEELNHDNCCPECGEEI